jgi:hypothetical protein
VILAFLRAEYHSPRFKAVVRQLLGGETNLVYEPRVGDPLESQKRRNILAAYRGFGRDDYLFRGFPGSVEWNRLLISPEEIGSMLYANYPTWVALSGGTRLVSDGAANVGAVNVDEDADLHVAAVEREIRRGGTFAELIAVAATPDSPLILLEGHTRATALVRVADPDVEVELLAGYSLGILNWAWY